MGETNYDDLGLSGDIEVGDDAVITDDMSVGGDLTVTGAATVTGVLTATGGVAGAVTGAITGNVTGNVTGDVTGDVTGNLTGDVTGDVTGAVNGVTFGRVSTAVDCSAGGTAQTAAIGTVPAGSVIMDVTAKVTAAFDGGTTKTFEVGIAGNTDAYIDPVDMATTLNATLSMLEGTNNDEKFAQMVTAATPIVATWTNTASATAGAATVVVHYMTLGLPADG